MWSAAGSPPSCDWRRRWTWQDLRLVNGGGRFCHCSFGSGPRLSEHGLLDLSQYMGPMGPMGAMGAMGIIPPGTWPMFGPGPQGAMGGGGGGAEPSTCACLQASPNLHQPDFWKKAQISLGAAAPFPCSSSRRLAAKHCVDCGNQKTTQSIFASNSHTSCKPRCSLNMFMSAAIAVLTPASLHEEAANLSVCIRRNQISDARVFVKPLCSLCLIELWPWGDEVCLHHYGVTTNLRKHMGWQGLEPL